MIPVEVTQAPWHATGFWDWVDHWQTLIGGGLAFAAGVGTVVAALWAIWVTRSTARKQIEASGDDARKVIAATREQTATTIRLERERIASEARAFHTMLFAAMVRVLDEAAWARKRYSQFFPGKAADEAEEANPSFSLSSSPQAALVRQCITKGAFTELRAACIRRGGDLTGEFLDLEREIDSFALQWEDRLVGAGALIRMGKHAGLHEQLARIETMANELHDKAAKSI